MWATPATTIRRVDSIPTPHDSLDAFLAGIERRAFLRARRATRDADEALDLVQDAMLRLSRHYASRPADEWPALFNRILTNRIRDWQRRQVLRQRLFFWRPAVDADGADEDPVEQVADATQRDIPDALHDSDLLRRVADALGQLPRRQREAFELRVWEGLSVEQSASAMGCSEGSVKTHLSRALAQLRETLEDPEP